MTDAVIIDLGDGPLRFRLTMSRVVQAERECGDRSIIDVLDALATGRGVAGHAAAIVRCAAPDPDAAAAHFEERPLADTLHAALAILTATVSDVRLKPTPTKVGERKPFRRGEVLTACGTLGLDWERVGLGEYLECVEAHNEQVSGDKPAGKPVSDEFKRMFAIRVATGS